MKTGTSTITVTSLGSFAGTVCLSQTGGNLLSPIISPTCVTVTAGSQATATITVAAIEGQTPSGTYTIIITGTSGSLTACTCNPPSNPPLTVVVASNTVKFNIQSEGTTVNPQTWVVTLTNRGTTTEFAVVQITVRSLTTGTQPITLTSQVVRIDPGQKVTFNMSHTFTVGQRYQWNAILLFGTNQSNPDQVAIPFRQGQFTVTG